MDLDSYLSVAGGLVIMSGIASYFLDIHRRSANNRTVFSIEGLIRFLGILGLIVLFCVAFGIVSWGISVIYWFVIERVAGAF